MIYQLERIVHYLLQLIGGWMFALAITLLLTLAVVAVLALNLYKFDRESCLRALRRGAAGLGRGWGWILTGVVLLIQVYCLTQLHQGLMERLSQQAQARYIATQDPGGSPTTQRTPPVSFLETTSRSQRIVLPPKLTGLDAVPGWNPEEARYGGTPAVSVQDELVKDDNAVVLNRTLTVQRYVPTKLLRSDVDLKLTFVDSLPGRNRQLYKADYRGRYTVQNPFSESRKLHFSFPLPDNSGTLAGFHFKVNGKEMPAQDVDRGLEWEGDLQPQEQAVVEVVYTHQGAQSWSYDVTGRREPITDFRLTVRADRPGTKFLRGSLTPTRFGQDGVLEWNLQNQITSQSISLFFPCVPVEKMISSLFIFAPLAVGILMLLTIVWGRLLGVETTAWRTCLACLACCGGYSLASYLLGYLPLTLSLLIAFGVTAALQWKAMGRRQALPIAVTAVAPFTFLAIGNTGLLLTILGLATLAMVIRETASPSRFNWQ